MLDAFPRDLALIPIPRSQAVRRVVEAANRPRALFGLSALMLLATIALLAGVTAPSLGLLLLGFAGYGTTIALGARQVAAVERALWPYAVPLTPDVSPDSVDAPDLRMSYESLLRTHDDVRRSILESERLHGCLRDLFVRCGDLVKLAGRLARAGNPLHRYLDDHARDQINADLVRLGASANAATDETAAVAYRQAVSGRVRQLETFLEIHGMRDRIRARLELVAATLLSVEALVVKLRSMDLEQASLPGESIAEQLRGVDDDIAALGAAMDEAFLPAA